MFKVYCIHPGAAWSTCDVYDGLVAGLRAQADPEVYEGRIDTILNWYDTAINLGVRAGEYSPDAYKTSVLNRQRMASAHITQSILDVWPDVVISVSGHNYHLVDADILRKVGIKTAVILTESPYFGDLEGEMARHYDVAFTNERQSAKRLNAQYLPHAYNPAVHTPDGPKGYAADVFFCGSMFDERKQLFNAADWQGVDFVWRGHDMSETPTALMPNAAAAAYYRAAKISLNQHRTTTSHGSGEHIAADEAESLNPRAYEIPACGGFMLCDDSRAEAKDIFRDSLATYKAGDADDLARQTRWWLAHPDMREEWAAAQHDCVRPHSWTARAGQVLDVLYG
jgi:spore maturation protein CgeB